MSTPATVRLGDVDEAVLDALAAVAVADASADEVTPPLTPGPAWTPPRREWFADYHRACRAGLAGPRRERTWAVLVDGDPAGAVRLAAVSEPGDPLVLEAGIWLVRSVRGRGVAPAAVRALLHEARALGAVAVEADTAVTNAPARAALARLGFDVVERGDRAHGRLDLVAPAGERPPA